MFNNHYLLTAFDCNASLIVDEFLWMTDKESSENLYQQIVYRVSRHPKHLISHLQRIYFTYTQNMPGQLYAALVDLLWILDGKGIPLSKRMILSTRNQLSKEQIVLFTKYCKQWDRSVLTGNKFTLFTTGQIGVSVLITECNTDTKEHDPLSIARDYIEYSQLGEAIKILEAAVFSDTKRQDLQDQLLELYKVIRDIKAFSEMHTALKDESIELSNNWQDLANYFSGNTKEQARNNLGN